MLKKFLFLFISLSFIFCFACNEKKDDDSKDKNNEEEVNYSIEIENTESEIYIGDSIKLKAKVYPESAPQDITWTYQNAWSYTIHDIAEIDGDTLTGINYGEIYIYASSSSIKGLEATFKLEVKHPLLEEENAKAYNISGFLGEDASSEFNIHYMIKNTKSFALVTTEDDSDFLNAKAYYGTGKFFESLDTSIASLWPARNIWDIPVTGLNENTKYIYKINNGDGTYSDIYHFKTSGGDSTTSFLFITDTHYAAFTDGTDKSAAVSETAIKNGLAIDPNVSFVLGGGDLIDTGGNEDIWNIYFNSSTYSRTALPYVAVTGNHEFYVQGTSQRDETYFGVYFTGPDNGAESEPNSTCWFIHNDTIFILMNNGRGVGDKVQLAWMANVLETQSYKHSIVVLHTPVEGGTWTNDNYIDVFDKYGVDLVLTGHTHGEAYYPLYFNNNKTDITSQGTTYLTGAYSGVKSAPSYDEAINYARNYIIDITNEGIKIRVMLSNGNIINEMNISYKNTEPKEEATKDELINSVEHTFNTETNTLELTFSKKFYKNVKKIIISEDTFYHVSNYAVCPTPAYTALSLKGLTPDRNYLIHEKIIFEDDSIYETAFEVNLAKDINLRVNENLLYSDMAELNFDYVGDDLKYTVSKFILTVNDQKYELNGLSYIKSVNSYILEDLTANTFYQVKLDAVDSDGNILFSENTSFTTPN